MDVSQQAFGNRLLDDEIQAAEHGTHDDKKSTEITKKQQNSASQNENPSKKTKKNGTSKRRHKTKEKSKSSTEEQHSLNDPPLLLLAPIEPNIAKEKGTGKKVKKKKGKKQKKEVELKLLKSVNSSITPTIKKPVKRIVNKTPPPTARNIPVLPNASEKPVLLLTPHDYYPVVSKTQKMPKKKNSVEHKKSHHETGKPELKNVLLEKRVGDKQSSEKILDLTKVAFTPVKPSVLKSLDLQTCDFSGDDDSFLFNNSKLKSRESILKKETKSLPATHPEKLYEFQIDLINDPDDSLIEKKFSNKYDIMQLIKEVKQN